MANAKPNTQEQFAQLVNISQQQVSKLIRKGTLSRGANVGQWLGEYLENLRGQAAQWQSADSIDRVREAALLDRSKRELLNLQIGEKKSRLLPLAAIVEVLRFHNTTVRTKLLALPHAYRNKVPELTPKRIGLAARYDSTDLERAF